MLGFKWNVIEDRDRKKKNQQESNNSDNSSLEDGPGVM